mgnify:CR=1 FL=1
MNFSVDLDGVLNFYPLNWLEFLRVEFGLQFESIEDAKQILTYAQYKHFKELFRASSYETQAPNRLLVIQSLNSLTLSGNRLFVHTSRAVHKSSYFTKTRNWLETTGLNFSELAFKTKDSFIDNNIVVHVDDDIEFLKEASGFSPNLNLFLFTSQNITSFETIDELTFLEKVSQILD